MRAARFGGWLLGLLLAFGGARPALAAEELPHAEAKKQLQDIETKLDAWDIAGAAAEIASLEAKLPEAPEPLLYFKGRVAFEEGRYADAIDLLTRAGIADREGSYLRLARETLKVTEKHHKVESAHFIFSFPPGKDEVLAPYALETLEAIRGALEKDLGHVPPGKIRVEVVNDARELAKVSTLTYQQIKTTGTIAICKFSKLMITSPKAVLRGYDWEDTLAHEFTHLVVTQKSRNTVPIWLHEGMAKYLESRWRGAPGQAMTPSTLALLGSRVKKDTLVPFEKMHPSMALLPTAEDAATAFAEVYFAIDLLYREHGTKALQTVIGELAAGKTDKKAVELAFGKPFPAFEKAWLAHVRGQPFPRELLPPEQVVLKDQDPAGAKKKEGKKGREVSYGEFAEVQPLEARQFAHLGELMRERKRTAAAAEEYGKAHKLVGDRYEAISNKYALALLELKEVDVAEQVLLGSLKTHPGSPSTQTHLGRIYLARRDFAKAKGAYLDALASDPFDPEIHFALLLAHRELGEKALEERARKAAITLTGATAEEVESVAKTFAREDLSTTNVPPAAPEAPASPPAAKEPAPTPKPAAKEPAGEAPPTR